MKGLSLLFILCFFQVKSFFFVGPDNSYSILLPKNMELVQVDSFSQGVINHIFVGMDEVNAFEYSFAVSVDNNDNNDSKDYFKEEKVRNYEKECDCKVLDVKEVKFTNFSSTEYRIEKQRAGLKLKGFVYFSKEASNIKSINIVSIGLEDNVNQINETLQTILNTMVLNL